MEILFLIHHLVDLIQWQTVVLKRIWVVPMVYCLKHHMLGMKYGNYMVMLVVDKYGIMLWYLLWFGISQVLQLAFLFFRYFVCLKKDLNIWLWFEINFMWKYEWLWSERRSEKVKCGIEKNAQGDKYIYVLNFSLIRLIFITGNGF